MQKFIQYTPTEILFGENTQAEVGKEVKKWGGSRVFIVYGGGSVKKSGLLAQVEEALEKEGIAVEASEVTMVPDNTVSLEGDAADVMNKLTSELEELDDVQDVYTNAELPEDME